MIESLLDKKWNAVSPRLGYLELHYGKLRMVVIAAYLPHGGYTDEDVESVYAQMSSLIKDARKRGYSILVAGDFNAEIASAKGRDMSVGKFANEVGNACITG